MKGRIKQGIQIDVSLSKKLQIQTG